VSVVLLELRVQLVLLVSPDLLDSPATSDLLDLLDRMDSMVLLVPLVNQVSLVCRELQDKLELLD